MKKKKYAIVVIAYNRLNSLQRVLKSLENATYNIDKITLIISIDKSDTSKVENYAHEYKWMHGEKIVATYPDRLGLRKHVIKCGMYLNDFDALIVLEDDTFVSPDFFNFAEQAIEFYSMDERIAGISLYSHLWQIESDRPFDPARNKYDAYFIQYAQSWGQIWLKNQWFDFIKWYNNSQDKKVTGKNIPRNISEWPDSSWLKYHIKYCIDNNKYFVYPYIGLSTNFSEVGEHNQYKNTKFQVPMMYDTGKSYLFSELDNKESVIYDSFFERKGIAKYLGFDEQDLTVDLYGRKQIDKTDRKYLLSTEILNYKVIKSFSLELKPHELNIINNVPGNEIILYDLTQNESNKIERARLFKWNYDNRQKDIRSMLKYIIETSMKKLQKILR